MAAIKDLTAKKIGKLMALEPTNQRDGRYVVWKCRCACGNETVVTDDCLINGNTTSCGCRKQELMENIHETLTFVNGTRMDYLKSRKFHSDNKSGFRGVYKLGDKYRASIGFQGKWHYLDTFHDFDEVVHVRQGSRNELYENYIRLCEWWRKRLRASPAG